MTSDNNPVSRNSTGMPTKQGLRGLLQSMETDLQKPLHTAKTGKTSLYEESKAVFVLLDCSTSMAGGDKLTQAKAGVMDFAKGSRARGYSVGLIAFSSAAELLSRTGDEIGHFGVVLSRLAPNGSTNMSAAIQKAIENFERQGNLQILIATDGMPDDPTVTLEVAQRAKDSGIQITTIGTDDADKSFLERLASTPERAVKVEQRQLLEGIKGMVKLLPP